MGREVSDYVALALVADLRVERDYFSDKPEDFSGDIDQLKAKAEEILRFPISDYMLQQVVRTLADCKLIRITDDHFSGTFIKIKASNLGKFVENAKLELGQAVNESDELSIITKPSDYPNASALQKHELFEDYDELGPAWLNRALDGLRKQVEQAGSLDAIASQSVVKETKVPASDRVVTFSDNQVTELDEQTTAIIDAVSAQNQIDGVPGLRELVLGQLKAGRELLRAGSFRLYLIELTLIETLRMLVKRYEKEAIGGLASALIAVLLKHIGIDA
ncbi:hypothetical protein [Sphingomonas mollis]|uniref:Uncharacterized protein n=1 Tax=Sphingomonas mollis TaxID=2795726 RepID=A0ABS0XTN8_9SPHN|nr:hypothetical protein [Sphingomonas sp. BT553]MBJ6123108.1 hypothetical protein [Sphingomonas sp. BT553]